MLVPADSANIGYQDTCPASQSKGALLTAWISTVCLTTKDWRNVLGVKMMLFPCFHDRQTVRSFAEITES